MLRKGLVKEVQQLITKYSLTEDSQSMKAIGYKETIDYLNHNIDLNGLADTISLSTQQLAKRQITWKNKFKINSTRDLEDIMARAEDIIKTSNIINLNLIIKRAIQEILDKKILSSV